MDRRPLAVVATTDGRRVHVPVELEENSLVVVVRSLLLGLEGLIGLLIAGGRGSGGTRRSR